jgi:hypothetical protein
MSKFLELRKLNVNDHTEKKGRFTDLSWAWAVDQLLQNDPSATWEYSEPKSFADGTMMVFCSVTAFGKTMTSMLPVINNLNKPISNPNAMDVNTAMQRCLVKAIALHGIGLYIYAGEDLPQEDVEPVDVKALVAKIASSKDMDELKTTFAEAYKAANKDKAALTEINTAKEARKAELA